MIILCKTRDALGACILTTNAWDGKRLLHLMGKIGKTLCSMCGEECGPMMMVRKVMYEAIQ
jgi:hypothetical protein